MPGWFEVDKDGLAQLVRRRGLAFILYELVQNAWDTCASEVVVELLATPGRPLAKLTVIDNDPEGFQFLEHGYTLYASSAKKGDPTKRGRFNLGEKLVLAACETAHLTSTTGTIHFERINKELRRRETRERRSAGSMFVADIRMTRAELESILSAADLLLPPIRTLINGKVIPQMEPLHTFEAPLVTEVADDEGHLRRTTRRTTIRLYPPKDDGGTHLYELGIPVVEIDLPWSVEVMQKIPLNSDRDNVTPAYRKALAVLVLNEMHQRLEPEHASQPLIQEALGNPQVSDQAIKAVLEHQFGEKRAVFDPSDPEANSSAFAHGYSVITGGTFTRDQWTNIRRAGAALPAGRLFPTPKPYDPEGDYADTIPEDQWTDGMLAVSAYAKALAWELMSVRLRVVMENERGQRYGANYGNTTLTFNVPGLGRHWFDLEQNSEAVNDLLIHEFGHEDASNHLDDKYYKALTRLGARMVAIALRDPEFFRSRGVKV